MNDKQLMEKKLNFHKRMLCFWAGVFLMGMLFVGGYIFKLPYGFGIPILVILVVCFVLMLGSSIVIKKIQKNMQSLDFDKKED